MPRDLGIPPGPPSIAIRPDSGSKDVPTDTKVWVQARNAKLTEVRVTDDDNREVGGVLSPDRTSWQAEAPVRVDTRYRVSAWAIGADNMEVEETSTFTSKDIEQSGTLEIESVTPENGARVGVAHPLVVAFNQPVANRKTIQSALRVVTTPPVEGAWYWIDEQHVHYRPREFWPADTKVELRARIAERDAGDGVLGGKNKDSEFTVGREQVIEVDARSKKLTVLRDGRAVEKFEVSTGKPGWETRSGTKVMMEKVGNKEWTERGHRRPGGLRVSLAVCDPDNQQRRIHPRRPVEQGQHRRGQRQPRMHRPAHQGHAVDLGAQPGRRSDRGAGLAQEVRRPDQSLRRLERSLVDVEQGQRPLRRRSQRPLG